MGYEDSSAREDGVTPQQSDYMRAYLAHHGLDDTTFTQLAHGKFPMRRFIPLPGQPLRGKVKKVKRSQGSDDADIAVIEAHIGLQEPLVVEAPRSRFSVYGHWMTKADLRYLIDNGKLYHGKLEVIENECQMFIIVLNALVANDVYCTFSEDVFFEYSPLDIERNNKRQEASLVWLGSVDDRPVYSGRSTQVNISASMESSLWSFVASKKMDEKMFRALVRCLVLQKNISGSMYYEP